MLPDGKQIGDRFLDLSDAAGEVFNDYAELTFTLSWQDDRDLEEVQGSPMEQFDMNFNVKEET